MKTTLNFETLEQAAIFWCELSGQISDGHWENYNRNNWETWCDADVTVDADRPTGRDFWVSTNLNMKNKKLFDVVGPRMMFYVRAAQIVDRLWPELRTRNKLRLIDYLTYRLHGSGVGLCNLSEDDKPTYKAKAPYGYDDRRYYRGMAKLVNSVGPIALLAEADHPYRDVDLRYTRRVLSAVNDICMTEV